MTVDALDKVLQDYPRNDHRHYLCHFTVLPPERTMQIMAKDKIHIAQQPNFTYNLEGRYVETLGRQAPRDEQCPHHAHQATDIFMAFGSDNLPDRTHGGSVRRRNAQGRERQSVRPGRSREHEGRHHDVHAQRRIPNARRKDQRHARSGQTRRHDRAAGGSLEYLARQASEHESRHDDCRRQGVRGEGDPRIDPDRGTVAGGDQRDRHPAAGGATCSQRPPSPVGTSSGTSNPNVST